jgi:AmpE protein
MGLISLLIALIAEKKLSAPFWQFNNAFSHYMAYTKKVDMHNKVEGTLFPLLLIGLPVVICFVVLHLISDSLLHLVLSTTILIVCFGCVKTRDSYKEYLHSAFRGESTTCDLYYQQLLTDKNLPPLGFGQTLIWLNYRYYIAVMVFFVLFGAAGALFYRLLCALDEQQKIIKQEDSDSPAVTSTYSNVLFWVDWLPVRIATFGFILVGHFSRAFPTWLENLFDINKQPQLILTDVAKKAEDLMIDESDCTAEPCLLVRLAKRNVLLLLASVAILTLSGIIV